MKRIWARLVERHTAEVIKRPWMFAFFALVWGLATGENISRLVLDIHRNRATLGDCGLSLVDLLIACWWSFLLARAVLRLRDGDPALRARVTDATVSRPGPAAGSDRAPD